jgi:hypothetical protein
LVLGGIATIGLASTSRGGEEPKKPERDTPPKIVRTERDVEGWKVQVDQRLLEGEQRSLGDRALRLLGDRLYEIAQFLPADRLAKLRAVTIVLDLDHGKLTSMQYHPGAAWLREHGYDPALEKVVHIPSASRMVELRHQRIQPWCVMHELAHAYHDQVYGFDDPEIRTVFDAAMQSMRYEDVVFIDGPKRRHYALTNQMEYFAELTEAYVGTNDFYPFVRGELKEHDPRAYELLEKIWGKLP